MPTPLCDPQEPELFRPSLPLTVSLAFPLNLVRSRWKHIHNKRPPSDCIFKKRALMHHDALPYDQHDHLFAPLHVPRSCDFRTI